MISPDLTERLRKADPIVQGDGGFSYAQVLDVGKPLQAPDAQSIERRGWGGGGGLGFGLGLLGGAALGAAVSPWYYRRPYYGGYYAPVYDPYPYYGYY